MLEDWRMKQHGEFLRSISAPSILKSRRPMGADSPRAQKCMQFSGVVEFATRGWWHADAKGDCGITLMKQCGTEELNGDGPLSFQDVVKDKVPVYESFATPQTNFLSKVQNVKALKSRRS